MKVLVLGATGRLGGELLRVFGSAHEVLGVGRSVSETRLQHSELSQSQELGELVHKFQPAWVINAAAFTAVDACDSPEAHFINATFPASLEAICHAEGARMLHFSTDSVFADGRDANEDDKTSALNIYVEQKIQAEDSLSGSVILRTNFYGAKRGLGRWMADRLFNSEGFTGFDDVYFAPLLNTEVARLTRELVEKDVPNGIWHLVGDDCVSKFGFGRLLANALGFDSTLVEQGKLSDAGLKMGRARDTCLSNTKLTDFLEHRPQSLAGGLQEFAREMRKIWDFE